MIVTFTSESIEDLSRELQEELYEYLRMHGASIKSVIRKKDRKLIEFYQVDFSQDLIDYFTKGETA